MEYQTRQIPTDGPRLLVVDDDSSTRLMVREVLAPAGFVIEEADGGRQGLRLVESFRPDVVLLDILMPEMDGFATLRSLRNQDHGADCPVVMITGLQNPNAVEMAYELGATDFVTKPINWSLLRHRLNYVLRSSTGKSARGQDPFENALRLAGVGAWRWDSETDRLSASDRFLRVLGLRRREPLATRLALGRVHRSDRHRVLRALRHAISGNGGGDIEVSFRVVARGRRECCVRVRAEVMRGDDGSVMLTGILEDISEKEALERKLHDLQSSARRIQGLIGDLLDPSPDEAAEGNR